MYAYIFKQTVITQSYIKQIRILNLNKKIYNLFNHDFNYDLKK